MQLARFPRFRLAHLPTPLEEMSRLTSLLGGPRLLVKRDDCTGLALGGSKARALEFLLGAALEEGADCVVTLGPMQSNHTRMTAAAARKAGLECVLVVQGESPRSPQGNVLLDLLMGARLLFFEEASLADLDDLMLGVVEDLRREGHRPYVIPGGGYSPIGGLGYVDAVVELLGQLNARGWKADALVVASGSGCAQSGLLVGTLGMRSGMEVIGITINRERETLQHRILREARLLSDLMGIQLELSEEKIQVYDEYLGPGYATPTTEGVEAMRLAAAAEGLVLDPTYTGKAMAGLISLVRSGRLGVGQTAVFLHTGGLPGLFASPEWFAAELAAQWAAAAK